MKALAESPPSAEQPRTRPPRVGFLGVGWIGRKRLLALAGAELVEVVAVADAVRDVATEVAHEVGRPIVTSSLEELLELELEGVVIATPNALHAAEAELALQRGVAVFCQKPLALTLGETRRIVAAARAANRLLGVDFSYRTLAAASRIRDLIRGGQLGRIYAIDLVFHNAYGPDKPWFYDPQLSGGGCVIDLGVHLADLLLWMLDYPEVTALSSRLMAAGRPLIDPGRQIEDYAIAQIDLAGGVTARLACSWRISAGCDAVVAAEFYGTEGGAALRNVGGSFVDFTAEWFRGTSRELLAAPPDPWGGRASAEWARRLAVDRGFDPAAERYLDVACVIDAIYGR
jgi:predicted dehydrogenase